MVPKDCYFDRVMTLSIKTLSVVGLFATLTIIVPSVTMLRVFIYLYTECNLVSVIMFNAIMLNVVVLSVMAPPFSCKDVFKYDQFHFNHFLLNVLGRLL
jgi:hypothetical protein